MIRKGDIFVAVWGYDQTNADFFQVVGKTKKSVKVKHIKKKIKDPRDQTMTGSATPLKGRFDGKEMTKRIYMFMGKEHFNAGNSFGSARKWNGKPVAISWYG